MITFNIITLFPQIIETHLEYLPFKRGIEKDLIKVNLVNLRDFAIDARGTVDEKPYGGGVGMILRIEPIYNALKSLNVKKGESSSKKIILMAPSGETYNQEKAILYNPLEEITLICGRYEGVDARVLELVDETVSIGNYVLSGGELPALVIMESIVRLRPGILEKEGALATESFNPSIQSKLEYPQYTRPEDFNGLKVPEILLSGNHAEIKKWQEKNLS